MDEEDTLVVHNVTECLFGNLCCMHTDIKEETIWIVRKFLYADHFDKQIEDSHTAISLWITHVQILNHLYDGLVLPSIKKVTYL